MKQDATALRWASEAFGNDRAVGLAAAKQWGASVLDYAELSFRDDHRVLLEAVGSMCTCEDLIGIIRAQSSSATTSSETSEAETSSEASEASEVSDP